MREIPTLFQKKEDCCGCSACFAICPFGAIEMIEDDTGFEHPIIDEKKCQRCHLCIRICPIHKYDEVTT